MMRVGTTLRTSPFAFCLLSFLRGWLGALLFFIYAAGATGCAGKPLRARGEIREEDWLVYRGSVERRGWVPHGVDAPLTLTWSTRIGSAIPSSPLVAGGEVYVVSIDGRVVLLDAMTGEKRGRKALRSDVLATPALRDVRLFIATTGRKRRFWTAMDLREGKILWRVEGGGVSSPLVAGGQVIVGSDRGEVVALDERTGEEIWRFKTEGPVRSAPAFSAGDVYVGCDGDRVYRLNGETGVLLWERDVNGSVYGAVAVSEEGVYVVTTSGWLYRLDRDTGEIQWSLSKGPVGFYVGPALDDQMLYAGGTNRTLYALDRATGEQQWTFVAAGVIRSAPVVTERTVYFGCGGRVLYALNKKSGALVWTYEAEAPMESSPAVTHQGVYIGAMDGTVYGFGRP